jgi:ATP-dependent DNA helicase RecG
MTVDQIRRLLAQGEGIQLEFKEAKQALPTNFFETVCAFLNRDGGTILLGVEDDGTVCGIVPSAVPTLKTNIANLSNNPEKLDPPCVLFPSHLQLDSKEVLCVQVLADSQLHRTRGVVYDRSEDGDFAVTDPARLAALYQRKRLFYTESTVYPHVRLQDLRVDLFPKVRQLLASRNPGHPWLTLDNHQLLVKAGLYQRDQQQQEGYTLAAVLLLGKDEVITQVVPHFRVDALLRRHDVQRYDDRLDIRTNLIDAYELLMDFVGKHLPDPFYLEGTTRMSLRDKIFREVVANILVHREYTNARPTTFIIYADQVVAENANVPHHGGALLLDTFAPYPKNPTLARFFLQLGRAEELGSGVLNVTHYLPQYVRGALPRFLDGPVFQTILPLSVSQLGSEAATLLLQMLCLPLDIAAKTSLAALAQRPALRNAHPLAPALLYQLGLGWLSNGTRLKLEKMAPATSLPTFEDWQGLGTEEKGTRLLPTRLLQLLRVLVLCLQPQSLAAVLQALGVSNRTKFRTSYIDPLLQRQLLTLTLPEIPSSPNQRYQTTEQGQLLLTGG